MDLKHRSTNLHDYLEKYLDADMFSELNVKDMTTDQFYASEFPSEAGGRQECGGRALSLYG